MRATRSLSFALLVHVGVACTPPDPQATLAAQILNDGDLIGAATALQAGVGRETGWEALAQRLLQTHAERQAVQSVERGMLLDAARRALDSDHPAEALPALRAGLRLQPDDPTLRALLQELLDRSADPATPPQDAVHVYGALLEARIPGLPDDLPDRLEAATLAHRYAPSHRQETLAGHQGVTVAAAAHLLEQLAREYHIPPDWTAMVAAGQQRLRVLMRWAPTPPPLSSPGALPDTAPVASQAEAVAALERALAETADCGLPTETRIAEWIEAALASLDPWTRAVWPAEIASWQAHHEGISYGVGVRLRETDAGSIFVDIPLPGTAAWESGVHQADRIDQIGDVVLAELPRDRRLDRAAAALLGDAGTTVDLQVTRLDVGELRFSLLRGAVKTETLEGFQREADNGWRLWLEPGTGLAYVRILGFRDYTEPDLDAFLAPIQADLTGLLLDLRSNPGGDLNASVQIADRFVEDGVLAQLSGRAVPQTTPSIDPETGEPLVPWNHAIRGHALEGIPVVILVDRDTASAAEILAGVLQERVGAMVLGAPTWGKGYTQVLRTVEDPHYAVQFTHQAWTLPSGRAVGAGIVPDVYLELGPGEVFQVDLLAQKRAALRTHADGTPMQWLDTNPREDLPPLSEDPLLLAGELLLRAMRYPHPGGM